VSAAAAVLALAVAMIEASLGTTLVAAVGATTLLESSLGAASRTAILLSAVAMLTDTKQRMAPAAAASPLTENDFAVNVHARPQAEVDNGNRSWQVRTSFVAW
jgi:hypothetical protein